jgi:EAL domain-containing protein (putative c-di-GMP-specific phosphodiesterase class I)
MAEQQEVEIERVIVKAIERHARGNPEALARQLVAELRRAGFEIRRRAER